MVLLPVTMLTQLPPEMLEAIIAHELAHIRRLDLWVNLMQRVVETLLFYHPVVWWLSNRLRNEREFCCDELAAKATGNRRMYASALEYAGRAKLATSRSSLVVNFGRHKMETLARVRHVLGMSSSFKQSRYWLAGVLTLAAVITLGIVAQIAVVGSDAKAKTTNNPTREFIPAKDASVTSQPQPESDEWERLVALSSKADLIAVAENLWQYDRLCAKQVLKGSKVSFSNIQEIDGIEKPPTDKNKQWILFLRIEQDHNLLLSPLTPSGWFAPYSEELAQRVVAATPLPETWGEAKGRLRMGLRLRKSHFVLGEDIPVEIYIKNVGQKNITLYQHRYNNREYDYYPFTRFVVEFPDGRRIELYKPELIFSDMDSPSPRTLTPGETYIHTVDLNEWTDWREPPQKAGEKAELFMTGTFKITCTYSVEENPPIVPEPVQPKNAWSGTLISSPTEFRVVQTDRATQQAENTDKPDWAKAVARALPGWEIIQCDRQPTVSVDSHKGYRLLLRKSHKEYLDPPQRPLPPDHPTMKKLKFVIKHSHVDLVLFQSDKDLPADIKENISWDDVEQQHLGVPPSRSRRICAKSLGLKAGTIGFGSLRRGLVLLTVRHLRQQSIWLVLARRPFPTYRMP
jgi:hypothetical protein